MTHFIGTKTVIAYPMTRGQYNDYRGWQLPVNEQGEDEGYLVEYTDGGQPNDERHAGYISWSPKAQFDAAYLPIGDVEGLPAHVQRVIGEYVQLTDKLTKLNRFVESDGFSKVDPTDQHLLSTQIMAMNGYATVLLERLKRAGVRV